MYWKFVSVCETTALSLTYCRKKSISQLGDWLLFGRGFIRVNSVKRRGEKIVGQTDRQKMAKREASTGLSPAKKKAQTQKWVQLQQRIWANIRLGKKIRQREAICLLHGVSLFNLPQVLLGIFSIHFINYKHWSLAFYCNEEKHIGDVKSPKLLISWLSDIRFSVIPLTIKL